MYQNLTRHLRLNLAGIFLKTGIGWSRLITKVESGLILITNRNVSVVELGEDDFDLGHALGESRRNPFQMGVERRLHICFNNCCRDMACRGHAKIWYSGLEMTRGFLCRCDSSVNSIVV